MHNPPFNLFTLLLLPIAPFKGTMSACSPYFSKFIFWLENILYVFGFLGYELCLLPVIYLLSFANIFKQSSNVCTAIGYSLQWFFVGVFILLYIVFYDIYIFIEILSWYKGCKAHHGLDHAEDEEEELEDDDLAAIYN